MKKCTFAFVRDFDLNFDETGLVRLWRVRGEKGEVISVVFLDLGLGEPFEGEGGDVKGVEEEKVVGVRSLFLPDFVLVVDDHLLLLVELWITR